VLPSADVAESFLWRVLDLPASVSRRDTTLSKAACLLQLPLGAQLGRRAWVHRALRLRVADSRRDRALAADIIRHRHYSGTWPARPRTLLLSYLASLEEGAASAAGLVTIALLPGNYHVTRALGLEQFEVLTLCRMWRADDLGPSVAPDFTPEMLRRVIRGERSRGPLRSLRDEWCARKLRPGGLRAAPRLLVTYADPAMSHDGSTYVAAGATYCGQSASGKLLFAWGLDDDVRDHLQATWRRPTAVEAERATLH
jgi:hypothetical protein